MKEFRALFAQTPGAKGVSEELAEAQDRMTKIKRKVNGN